MPSVEVVAKARLLADELAAIGIDTRLVRWQYRLPALVDEQRALAFDSDVHTAVQARIDDRWVLVDATHDSPLGALGLVVGQWDGCSPTEPAYPPLSPLWVVGDPRDDRAAAHAKAHLLAQIRATSPGAVAAYRNALNALFASTRTA